MARRDSEHQEPGRMQAGVFAVLVHIIFFAFMIFGLNWKTYPPEGMMVDVWSSLPPPPQPARPVIKAAPPAPEPPRPVEPPKAVEPPQEAKPLPPKVETPPPPPKPDIALKEKVEKPKPVEKKPAEKKQPSQKELKQQKEKEEKEQKEKAQREKEQKDRIAAEVEQLQREQQAANEKLRAQAAQAAAQSRLANEIDEYKAKILAKIRRNIVMPPDLPGNPVAEFDVTLLPGGDILDVKLRTSSGFAAFDSAVERGIFLSKPLPLPPDPALFSKFRNLSVKVHYQE